MPAVLCWVLWMTGGHPTDGLAQSGQGTRNSLGMLFLKVRGSLVLFSIWETRVSDWNAYMADTHQSWSHQPSFPQTDTHPVVNVTLSEAAAFADWLTKKERREGRITSRQTYRLPTNLEWDAAVGHVGAEAGNALRFPWGAEWPPPRQAGNYNSRRIEGGKDDGYEFTAPVGQFRPSSDGLFDLGGNAWEWASDTQTPTQAIIGTLRGGSWLYWRKECLESTYHFNVQADLRSPTVGFRCVLENAAEIEAARARASVVEQQERTRLLERPTASTEEVLQAQNRLATNPGATTLYASQARVADARKNQPSPGHPFVNSLAYRLLPVPGARLLLLGESEVRERDYQMFVLATPDEHSEQRRISVEGDHAVAEISWEEAVSFCKWLTQKEINEHLLPEGAKYRLPTLVEWRAAAADGKTLGENDFPWGTTWPPGVQVGNIRLSQVAGGARGHVTDVKLMSPNKAGFYDLIGNVAEWCADIPAGKDSVRWYCGGSWKTSNPTELRGRAASEAAPNERLPTVGFRLLLELPWEEKEKPANAAP